MKLWICDKYQSCVDRVLCPYAIPHETVTVRECPLRVNHAHKIVEIVKNVVII